jgi:hypothetical protein
MSTIWKWIAAHPIDIAIAVVLSLIAALVIEVFKVGWRGLRNLISPTSIKEIDRRINEQLEWRRILTNDKALYLTMFRALFGTILLLCVTASTFILSYLTADPTFVRSTRLMSDWMLIIVGMVCISSMRTAAVASKERVEARIAKIDKKIAELREKRSLLSASSQ